MWASLVEEREDQARRVGRGRAATARGMAQRAQHLDRGEVRGHDGVESRVVEVPVIREGEAGQGWRPMPVRSETASLTTPNLLVVTTVYQHCHARCGRGKQTMRDSSWREPS